jgi:hypothetical protein
MAVRGRVGIEGSREVCVGRGQHQMRGGGGGMSRVFKVEVNKYVHKDDRGTGQGPEAREDVDDSPHKVHDDFHPSDCLLLAWVL